MHDQREIFQTVHGMNRCWQAGQLLYRAFIAPILHEKLPGGQTNAAADPPKQTLASVYSCAVLRQGELAAMLRER